MYVLLGANGNITSKAARILLSQGKAIRVVGRRAQNLAPLRQAGAELAIGSVSDAEFLATAMRGAEGVYAMIPPNYAWSDLLGEQNRIGEAIARAIGASGVARVVNLSSTGAHLPAGTGPIAALHAQEQRLDRIPGLELLHLRPGYFFENHLQAIEVIQALGVYADMVDPSIALPSLATADIAAVVARELAKPASGESRRILHLHGPKSYTQSEATAILGAAIGRPNLKYVKADPAEAKAGMVQAGISRNVAELFEEMSTAFSRPEFMAEMLAGPTESTPTALEDFAPIFKAAYQRAQAEAASAATPQA